jgi:hypothetical protein
MHLTAEPIIPVALWLALAVVAIASWSWYAWRRRVAGKRWFWIVAFMGISLAIPLVVLLNPTWVHRLPPPAGKPIVSVLVDVSLSMDTRDIENGSRLEAAKTTATRLAKSLEKQYDLSLWTFASQGAPADQHFKRNPDENLNVTDLVATLRAAIRDDAPQGQAVVLLSDGIHNRGASAAVLEMARRAQTLNAPVFTVTVGGQASVVNASVALRSPQELAFVGQSFPIVVEIQSQGLAGMPLRVELWNEQEMIDHREFRATNSGRDEISFSRVEDKTGLTRYEIRLITNVKEATADDNRAALLVRTIDRPVKMLLVEGKPYWDTKFLVRNLVADPSIELTSIVRMVENRFLKRTARRTTDSGDAIEAQESDTIVEQVDNILSSDSLRDVQIVLLGRNAEVFLSDASLEALRNWIARDGGSLVCVRGSPSSQISQRLGSILPVAWTPTRESRFRMALSEEGRDLRWLAGSTRAENSLAALPSLATAAESRLRPGLAQVLAASTGDEDSRRPVVTFQPYGTGRTVVIEGAGMWRWALLPPEHADLEQAYPELWSSLLRWLSSRDRLQPGQSVLLQADRVSFTRGDEVTATLLVRDELTKQPPNVRLDFPKNDGNRGESRLLTPRPVGQEPGVFRIDFSELPVGVYSAHAIRENEILATTLFDVRESWQESLDLRARPELMDRLATESGGTALQLANVDEFVERFDDYQTKSTTRPLQRISLWDRWWWLLGAFGFWAATWGLRRITGLI